MTLLQEYFLLVLMNNREYMYVHFDLYLLIHTLY